MEPQSPKKAETQRDFNNIARSLLQAVSANETGALGGQIIGEVQESTGYEPAAVAVVFAELGDTGVVERSLEDPRAGVVLSKLGQHLLNNFDELMPSPDVE